MEPTTLSLHSAHRIGEVSPHLFGGFLEHMGRAVYQGVFDPESRHADEHGFRRDVLAALDELGFTIMRYPGGNFVSGYHWRDGIGPRAERPTVRELAWQSIEPNQMGTDEFIALCRKLGWDPMLAVNLGTGTPEEARDWVEYCNAPTGTRFADLRAANGSSEPHGVRHWCLGNEMDGPWQLGHVPADQYAIRAQQAAKMMHDLDPRVQLTACGSSGPRMPSYLEWDRTVLEHLGTQAHYLSLHRYVGNWKDDTLNFLAVTNSVDQQIEDVDACARYVQAARHLSRRSYLCFDEWNVWYKVRDRDDMNGRGQLAPHLIEEVYNLEDALVVAGFLMSFIRHADVVKIANLAQIVNVIAPILTRGDELLRQSIFYAFKMISTRARGTALRQSISGPSYQSQSYGPATFLDAASVLDASRLHVFLTNRSPDEPLVARVELADRGIRGVRGAELLNGPDAKTANSWEQPETLVTRPFDAVELKDGAARVTLPPLAFAATSFDLD